MKKLLLYFLLAAAIFLPILIGTSFVNGTGIFEYIFLPDFPTSLADENIILRHYYEQLNEDEKQAYRCIYNEIEYHPERIRIPLITSEQMNNVFNALIYDNPALLCIENGGNIQMIGKKCWFAPSYANAMLQCDSRKSELMYAAEHILSKLELSMSDYDKEKLIHDSIISKCSYTDGENPNSAYGALVQGEATCVGYAKSAMLLLNCAGIKSCIILGDAENPDGEIEGHAWNIVWIDGLQYHLDLTWDDPVNENPPEESNNIRYAYFNLCDEEISRTHSDFSFEPGCVYTAANYYRQEGLFFSSCDTNTLKAIEEKLIQAIKIRQKSEFKFSNTEALRTAVDILIREQKIYDIIDRVKRVSGAAIKTNKMLYLANEEDCILHLAPVFEDE